MMRGPRIFCRTVGPSTTRSCSKSSCSVRPGRRKSSEVWQRLTPAVGTAIAHTTGARPRRSFEPHAPHTTAFPPAATDGEAKGEGYTVVAPGEGKNFPFGKDHVYVHSPLVLLRCRRCPPEPPGPPLSCHVCAHCFVWPARAPRTGPAPLPLPRDTAPQVRQGACRVQSGSHHAGGGHPQARLLSGASLPQEDDR